MTVLTVGSSRDTSKAQLKWRRLDTDPIQKRIVTQPDYIHWLIEANLTYPTMLAMRKDAIALIRIFDKLPIVTPCMTHAYTENQCDGPATVITLYGGSWAPYFWCEACAQAHRPWDPPIVEARTYFDALMHVKNTCDDSREFKRRLIREIAYAKGWPRRATDEKICAFYKQGLAQTKVYPRMDT